MKILELLAIVSELFIADNYDIITFEIPDDFIFLTKATFIDANLDPLKIPIDLRLPIIGNRSRTNNQISDSLDRLDLLHLRLPF